MTDTEADPDADGTADTTPTNDPDRFDRLPATAAERRVPQRPTRAAVLEFFADRYGIDLERVAPAVSFWERGAGTIWAFAGGAPDPCAVEGLGLVALRTRREHWKPTLEAAQRFGATATRNVLTLSEAAAERFLAGEDQPIEWDGDWGYLLVAHEFAGDRAVIGVGLYLHGELRTQVPKGRRADLRGE